ncbi:asparagine synthase (glutamine-hydrolyzing) [Paenibacillus massiliensis]|uniref:asparagine synthase (glutamine-hydrolyzing) n=1 Tax=Paenibacillus massiliensis TaxID=225917 RepID=UPI0003770C87|nr:asparagine synthase (glutamine-hydrolyzing) [Paenibacillus massiliensis]
MCGITGIYNYKNFNEVSLGHIQMMNDTLSYRGPDGNGVYRSKDRHLGLGHRRLAITDLSQQANQPMSNEDGSLWIVFNGEIYNHTELRYELQLYGHVFRTHHSDTEVILHAYEQWGMEFVHRLRGMYAFAIWDEPSNKLLLVRDRIGIKPVFYSYRYGFFAFASEIHALQRILPVQEFSETSIYHYLTFLTVPAPLTMYKHVLKLEAGTYLVVEADGITITPYWEPETYLSKPLSDSYSTAYEHTEFLIKDSVSKCGMGDVPLCASLSSGVDSSIVAALLKKEHPELRTVTMDYEVPSPYSEAVAAQEIANQLNIQDQVVYTVTSTRFFAACNEYLQQHNDGPVGAQDIILFYMMSKRLNQQGYKICVLGEGADECGGYPSYLKMNDEHRLLSVFSQMNTGVKEGIFKLASTKWKEHLSIAMGNSIISRKHIQSFSEYEKSKLWCGEKNVSSYDILEDIMNRISTHTQDNFIRKVLNVEFRLRLPEFMLPRVDYPTMACSLEARVPFLDHHLVEYSLQLDNSVKMKDNIPKRMFKELLSNYVNQKYVYRPKLGFGKVMAPLLNETLPTVMHNEIISKPNHVLFSVIHHKALVQLWQEHAAHKNRGFQLWTLYGLGKWMELNTQ